MRFKNDERINVDIYVILKSDWQQSLK